MHQLKIGTVHGVVFYFFYFMPPTPCATVISCRPRHLRTMSSPLASGAWQRRPPMLSPSRR